MWHNWARTKRCHWRIRIIVWSVRRLDKEVLKTRIENFVCWRKTSMKNWNYCHEPCSTEIGLWLRRWKKANELNQTICIKEARTQITQPINGTQWCPSAKHSMHLFFLITWSVLHLSGPTMAAPVAVSWCHQDRVSQTHRHAWRPATRSPWQYRAAAPENLDARPTSVLGQVDTVGPKAWAAANLRLILTEGQVGPAHLVQVSRDQVARALVQVVRRHEQGPYTIFVPTVMIHETGMRRSSSARWANSCWLAQYGTRAIRASASARAGGHAHGLATLHGTRWRSDAATPADGPDALSRMDTGAQLKPHSGPSAGSDHSNDSLPASLLVSPSHWSRWGPGPSKTTGRRQRLDNFKPAKSPGPAARGLGLGSSGQNSSFKQGTFRRGTQAGTVNHESWMAAALTRFKLARYRRLYPVHSWTRKWGRF